MEREKVQLSNRDVSALVMDVPLQLESPWDCAMNVHHQLWLRSNDQEVRVAQRWMKWWGWMPRFLGSRILDASIDDLAVSAVGAVNRRI